jgi:hypothetical protein
VQPSPVPVVVGPENVVPDPRETDKAASATAATVPGLPNDPLRTIAPGGGTVAGGPELRRRSSGQLKRPVEIVKPAPPPSETPAEKERKRRRRRRIKIVITVTVLSVVLAVAGVLGIKFVPGALLENKVDDLIAAGQYAQAKAAVDGATLVSADVIQVQRAKVLASWQKKAQEEFDGAQYEQAADTADQILVVFPEDKVALKLREEGLTKFASAKVSGLCKAQRFVEAYQVVNRPGLPNRLRLDLQEQVYTAWLPTVTGHLNAGHYDRAYDAAAEFLATVPAVPETGRARRQVSEVQMLAEVGRLIANKGKLPEAAAKLRKLDASLGERKAQLEKELKATWLQYADEDFKRGDYDHASETCLALLKAFSDHQPAKELSSKVSACASIDGLISKADFDGAIKGLGDNSAKLPPEQTERLHGKLVAAIENRVEEFIKKKEFNSASKTLTAYSGKLPKGRKEALEGKLRTEGLDYAKDELKNKRSDNAEKVCDVIRRHYPNDPEVNKLFPTVSPLKKLLEEAAALLDKEDWPNCRDKLKQAADLLARASSEGTKKYTMEYQSLKCIVLARAPLNRADTDEAVGLIKSLLPKGNPPHLEGLCQALAALTEQDPELLVGALNEFDDAALGSLPANARPYVYYARALIHQKQGKPNLAAKDLVDAFQDDSPVAKSALRRERAVTILQEAARKLRVNEGLTRPYSDSANAETAFQWLDKARSLWKEGQPLSPSLRTNLALAAWYKPKQDGALARQLTAALGPGMLEDATDVGPLLLVQAQAHADSPQGQEVALLGYSELLDHVTKKGAKPIADEDLYKIILKPATALGDALVRAKPGSGHEKRVAALHAAEGRLIRDRLNARWLKEDVKNPLQKAFELYQRAFELDDQQAEYLVGRAYAASQLPDPKWDQLLSDAEHAEKLDSKHYGAHGLRGYVLLLKSRHESDRDKRVGNLRDSVAAFKAGLAAKGNERDAEYANLLTNSSISHLELGNFLVKESERKEHLYAARDEAKLATDAQLKHPYPEYAWEALGDALEDIAWLLGETGPVEKSTYAEAIEAFGNAIRCQQYRPQPWLGRGRCQYRWVESGTRGAAKDLDVAIEDLKEAIKRGPNSAEAAEASYWLATIYMRPQGQNYALADKYFDDAATVAAKCHSRDWSEFALKGWAQLALNQKDAGKARERAAKLKAFNAPDAARIIGRSYVLEGKPKDALQVYNDALPEPSDMNPSHVLLIMARVELLLKYLPGELLSSYPATLAHLDRAADLAPDRLLKAAAIGAAGMVRYMATGKQGLTSAQRDMLRSDAAKDLDKAIILAPRHSDAWLWRYVWVELLSLKPQKAPAEIKKALERIREASKTVPSGTDYDRIRERIDKLVEDYEGLSKDE